MPHPVCQLDELSKFQSRNSSRRLFRLPRTIFRPGGCYVASWRTGRPGRCRRRRRYSRTGPAFRIGRDSKRATAFQDPDLFPSLPGKLLPPFPTLPTNWPRRASRNQSVNQYGPQPGQLARKLGDLPPGSLSTSAASACGPKRHVLNETRKPVRHCLQLAARHSPSTAALHPHRPARELAPKEARQSRMQPRALTDPAISPCPVSVP